MAKLNLKAIKTDKELVRIAKFDLEGETLREVMESIIESDETSRVLSKAGVGYVIEHGYFGIPRNSTAGADIEHLGIEIKTCSLKRLKSGKLTVKEPISLNIINYKEEYKNDDIRNSSLFKKNKKILFICYIQDKGLPRSEYIIKYVFLLEMDDEVINEIKDDYKMILDYIKRGDAHNIHQRQHKYLTLCPKHSGTFKDSTCRKSKTTQPFNQSAAEIRAFRFKHQYMLKIIRRYLAKENPEILDEFKEEKISN
ncbi:hypothetical protein KBD45_06505 [Candidatus Dojkabacteria bacterium]|nr:hypothetical protein [Candidatus Dojkabacteria bacterium]